MPLNEGVQFAHCKQRECKQKPLLRNVINLLSQYFFGESLPISPVGSKIKFTQNTNKQMVKKCFSKERSFAEFYGQD